MSFQSVLEGLKTFASSNVNGNSIESLNTLGPEYVIDCFV